MITRFGTSSIQAGKNQVSRVRVRQLPQAQLLVRSTWHKVCCSQHGPPRHAVCFPHFGKKTPPDPFLGLLLSCIVSLPGSSFRFLEAALPSGRYNTRNRGTVPISLIETQIEQ